MSAFFTVVGHIKWNSSLPLRLIKDTIHSVQQRHVFVHLHHYLFAQLQIIDYMDVNESINLHTNTVATESSLVKNQQAYSLSLRSTSRRCGRLHQLTPCRSIQSTPLCHWQAKIKQAQIILNHSQPGLHQSTGSALPVFGRTPNAGRKSSRMVSSGVGTTKVAKERQALSMTYFSFK